MEITTDKTLATSRSLQVAYVSANYGMPYYVYITASQRNGTLYTGVTNNLTRRIFEHKEKTATSFTARYGVSQLVYFEEFERIGGERGN